MILSGLVLSSLGGSLAIPQGQLYRTAFSVRRKGLAFCLRMLQILTYHIRLYASLSPNFLYIMVAFGNGPAHQVITVSPFNALLEDREIRIYSHCC